MTHKNLLIAGAVLILTGLVVFAPSLPHAQVHAGYCDNAESTADAMACVTAHKKNVQHRLNEAFEILSGMAEAEETLDGLTKAQNKWVAYRDAQCTWDSAMAANPSLKRLHEVSCITALTEQRLQVLQSFIAQENRDAPREFSIYPRWMNVIAHSYPDVFWQYGKSLRTDLNCDGEAERIISGLRITVPEKKTSKPQKDSKNAAKEKNATAQKTEIVIAVTDNPATGRPHAYAVNIPLKAVADKKGPFLCQTTMSMALSDRPVTKKSTAMDAKEKGNAETSAKTCQAAVQISDKKCPPMMLYYEGEQYRLAPLAAQNSWQETLK